MPKRMPEKISLFDYSILNTFVKDELVEKVNKSILEQIIKTSSKKFAEEFKKGYSNVNAIESELCDLVDSIAESPQCLFDHGGIAKKLKNYSNISKSTAYEITGNMKRYLIDSGRGRAVEAKFYINSEGVMEELPENEEQEIHQYLAELSKEVRKESRALNNQNEAILLERGDVVTPKLPKPVIEKLIQLAIDDVQFSPHHLKALYNCAFYPGSDKDKDKQKQIFKFVATQGQVLERDIAAKAHSMLGYIAMGEGNFDMAMSHYQEGKNLNVKEPTIPYNRACCYVLMGNFEEAYENIIVLCELLDSAESSQIISYLKALAKDDEMRPLLENREYNQKVREIFSTLIPDSSEYRERTDRYLGIIKGLILAVIVFLIVMLACDQCQEVVPHLIAGVGTPAF